MAMGECSVYSSLQADLKVKFAVCHTVGGHLVLTNFCPDDPNWALAYGWCRRWLHYIVLGISILRIV